MRDIDEDLVYRQEAYNIVGACLDVYHHMGCGFLEAVYQECLSIELARREIPFQAQPLLALAYKGTPLAQRYAPDFVCYGMIIVEIKAVSNVTDAHFAQVHNYLTATGMRLGLLVNFGHHPGLYHKRVVH